MVKKKNILLGILIVLLLYPILSVYRLELVLGNGADPELVSQRLTGYQISIWLSWVVMISVAIFHKWTTGKNSFFYFIYCFLLLAFGVFGYYSQEIINDFGLQSGFKDDYTFGVFAAITNFIVAALLTAFLQASVWWFTRRWHRR